MFCICQPYISFYFKIDFSKSRPTTKRGGYFLHILLSGKYSLDELIGLSITNNLDKIQ